MSAPFERRQFLTRAAAVGGGLFLAGGAAELLAACGSSSGSAAAAPATTAAKAAAAATRATSGTVTFQLSWIKDEQWAGEYEADAHGYWTQQGLAVNLVPAGPSGDGLSVVQSGKALVTQATPDSIAAAIVAGADFKIVGCKYQKSPYAVTSLAKKPVNTPADLRGKKIGVASENLTIWKTFLKLNNIDPASVTVVPVEYDVTPLAVGQVDGLLSFITDEPIELGTKGIKTTSFLLDDYHYKIVANCYVVQASTLQSSTESALLREFLIGSIKGWQDAVADPQGATNLSVANYSKTLKLDPVAALQTVQATLGLITANGAGTSRGLFMMDPQAIADSIATIAAGGGAPLPQDAFVSSMLSGIYGSKTRL
jgi:ABC-type nitrate/sulfonate/bicarbonate transport system substrate-binding protein